MFKFANRDHSPTNTHAIVDAYCVHSVSNGIDMWYLSSIDGYIYTPTGTKLKDLAYE